MDDWNESLFQGSSTFGAGREPLLSNDNARWSSTAEASRSNLLLSGWCAINADHFPGADNSASTSNVPSAVIGSHSRRLPSPCAT